MTGEQTFQTLYRQLNSEQRRAVDAIEGPVMVVAGPGTGKTQMLTLRIANILKQTDTPADAILALTFTEAAAQSMRRRLVDIIGSDGYRVHFHTFHGFCNEVIQQYPESFPRIIGATNLTDADKIDILKQIITETEGVSLLRPYGKPSFYVGPLRQKISELKRENVSPKRLDEIVSQQRAAFEADPSRYHESGPHAGKMKGEAAQRLRKIEKNEELAQLYAAYEQELTRRQLYDYEDMIVETIKALEHDEDLLRTLQETYHYILADEHQDANAGQNRLLELLASFHQQPNLFVVGDEKQAIYRFQGASLENFTAFQRLYPDALTIELTENYRSPQPVLDAAHQAITAQSGETDLRKPLTGRSPNMPAHVTVGAFSHPEYEIRYVADAIRERIQSGVRAEEVAVLYRTNREAGEVVRVFEQLGIPFSLASDQNVLADSDVQKFVTLLRAVANFGSDEALMAALHVDFLQVPPLDLYRLARYAREQHIPIHDIIRLKRHRRAARLTAPDHLGRLYQQLEQWKTRSENEPLPAFFEHIAHNAGLIAHVLASSYATDKIEKLHALFGDVQSLVSVHREYGLRDYLAYLDLLEEHGVSISVTTKNAPSGAVQLMTAHRAKGQEFNHVYVVGLVDGQWGNRRKTEHFDVPLYATTDEDATEDERRLFYVALTRAKQDATLTYSQQNVHGRETLPSQFLGEIPAFLRTELETERFEQQLAGTPLIAPRTAQTPSIKEQQYLGELFASQGLSVTALNNYLSCPWQYFYRNLLRVPEVPDKHLLYGTAVHGALREFFDHYRQDENPSVEWLLQRFEDYLRRQPLTQFEYDESLEKGKTALAGYIRHHAGQWPRHLQNELRIAVNVPTGLDALPQLQLRGDLDKVEYLTDTTVNVVDYKTGKPKSRNHILGNTKAPDAGNYYRQLVFYKILMDHYAQGRYQMQSGQIDFVEPDDRDRFRAEQFDIPQEDVDALLQQAIEVAAEIQTLAFWDRRCDDAQCRYCRLRELMV